MFMVLFVCLIDSSIVQLYRAYYTYYYTYNNYVYYSSYNLCKYQFCLLKSLKRTLQRV